MRIETTAASTVKIAAQRLQRRRAGAGEERERPGGERLEALDDVEPGLDAGERAARLGEVVDVAGQVVDELPGLVDERHRQQGDHRRQHDDGRDADEHRRRSALQAVAREPADRRFERHGEHRGDDQPEDDLADLEQEPHAGGEGDGDRQHDGGALGELAQRQGGEGRNGAVRDGGGRRRGGGRRGRAAAGPRRARPRPSAAARAASALSDPPLCVIESPCRSRAPRDGASVSWWRGPIAQLVRAADS